MLCYILVGFLGVTRLLERWAVLSIFIASMIARPVVVWIHPGSDLLSGTSVLLLQVFLAGMLCYLFRGRIRLDRRVAALALIALFASIHYGFGKQTLPFLGTYVVL